ncbi:MAG: S-ribosylhomocysteine lyase [Oscillospiraceae bacterium]|nr:S-ribosylhomocysteine lyase [Oscillospiraceae bacterium]
MKPSSVKSFSRDHRKIRGGTVTIYDQYDSGDCVIKKADIRFRTPNTDYMSPEVSHTLEHLLADSLYRMTTDMDGEIVLDLSPMGCLTGFYCTFITQGRMKQKRFWLALMRESRSYDEIPGARPDSCGNYRFHSLKGAKDEIEAFLVEFEKPNTGGVFLLP